MRRPKRGAGAAAVDDPDRNGVMDDAVEFDPALMGYWPVGRGAGYEPELDEAVRAALLETKSEPSPVAEMQSLLNAEEAEAKLAKADAKSAVDALSLITRTMEKIDGLQRGLADAIARETEESFDDGAYQTLLADIERKIGDRAEERARLLLAEWTAAAPDGTGPPTG